MKEGHSFGKEHGFTGSANPGKEYGATCPGFKHGRMVKPPIMPHTVQPMDSSNDDEMSAPSGPGFKHGGMHRKEHHEKHDQVKYDKHGFEQHKHHK